MKVPWGGGVVHGVAGTSMGSVSVFELVCMIVFLVPLFTKSPDPLGTRAVALTSRV